MYAALTTPMTFEAFLAWDDGSGRDFELLDGVPVPLSEPNANHEDLIQRLCSYLENHCQENNLPILFPESSVWVASNGGDRGFRAIAGIK
jgi:Putative restriction endonuclease